MFGRKGQHEVLTSMLLVGVLLAVVSSVYFWGVPLIEKNKDISILQKSEDFMKRLNDRVKSAANGGSDQISFDLPGELVFDPDTDKFELKIRTTGTIYTEGLVPLVRDTSTMGMWGVDSPEILTVLTQKLGENRFFHNYTMSYKTLAASTKCYQINLTGTKATTGTGHNIYVKYSSTGTSRGTSDCNNKDLINTKVEITVV